MPASVNPSCCCTIPSLLARSGKVSIRYRLGWVLSITATESLPFSGRSLAALHCCWKAARQLSATCQLAAITGCQVGQCLRIEAFPEGDLHMCASSCAAFTGRMPRLMNYCSGIDTSWSAAAPSLVVSSPASAAACA